MKKNGKTTVTTEDLAEALALSKRDAVEIELRSGLNSKIIEVVRRRELTHSEVSRLAGTSRTRATALLNSNTRHISTSLMIRVLAGLGVDDDAFREHGLGETQLARIADTLATKDATALKSPKLKPWKA